jgi:hypothetical protein
MSAPNTLIGDYNTDNQTKEQAGNSTFAYSKKYYHVTQNTSKNVMVKKGTTGNGTGSDYKICCSTGYGKTSQTGIIKSPTDSLWAANCKNYDANTTNPDYIYMNKWVNGYTGYSANKGANGLSNGTYSANEISYENTDNRPTCWLQPSNVAQSSTTRYCMTTIPKNAFDSLSNSTTNKLVSFTCTGLDTNTSNSGTGTFSAVSNA